jgi:hypothetical protein
MYEVSWLKLSERYYKAVSWPAVELIADVVDQDHVFCLLYKVQQQPIRKAAIPWGARCSFLAA